jgi:hypothetical protein
MFMGLGLDCPPMFLIKDKKLVAQHTPVIAFNDKPVTRMGILEAVNDTHSVGMGMVAHDKNFLPDPRFYNPLNVIRQVLNVHHSPSSSFLRR